MKMTRKTKPANGERLFLVEYYVIHAPSGVRGWDIRFAWVFAPGVTQAKEVIRTVKNFDEVITISEEACITPIGGVKPLTLQF